MTSLQFGGWHLEVDVEGTRREYLELASGGCEKCGCSRCRNFAQIRGEAYPEAFKAMLTTLGVDWRKESEVEGLDRPDHVLYVGWFHLLGRIVEGPRNPPMGEPIGNGVVYWFSSEFAPGPPSLLDGITVQFSGVRGRWVLAGPLGGFG